MIFICQQHEFNLEQQQPTQKTKWQRLWKSLPLANTLLKTYNSLTFKKALANLFASVAASLL